MALGAILAVVMLESTSLAVVTELSVTVVEVSFSLVVTAGARLASVMAPLAMVDDVTMLSFRLPVSVWVCLRYSLRRSPHVPESCPGCGRRGMLVGSFHLHLR